MQITINERVSNDDFKGTIQISACRPVYKTSYYSPLLNYNDETFILLYRLQTIEFNQTATNPNLASALAFYAYE